MSSNNRWLFSLRSLPHAALALAACAGSSTALAQNIDNGRTLYRRPASVAGVPLSCDDCHGPGYIFKAASTAGAISGAIGANRGGMGAFSFLTATEINDIAAYVAADTAPVLPPFQPAPGSPAPRMTPTALPETVALPNTAVGTASTLYNVQFTNPGTTTVQFSIPAFGTAAGDTADFQIATPTAGTQCISGHVLGNGLSCWFGVRFKPTAIGTRTATWTMSFVGAAPRTITLQGMGTDSSAAPAPAPAPAPTPAPTAANAPTSGGGGALDWIALAGLGALSGVAARRQRPR